MHLLPLISRNAHHFIVYTVSAYLSSVERFHHMPMNARSAKKFPTARTTRRVRDEGLWYDATPTRDSSRRTRSAGGVARACRIGVQSARRGEKQRRTMGSYPLTCRAQRGKNHSIGSRASNTLHQRKPAVKREREKTEQASGQENVLYSHS